MRNYYLSSILLTFLSALCIFAPQEVIADSNAGHEYVDLGLPSGTLWATCNLGATSPEGYGLFFAWGETTGYNSLDRTFDWTTYGLCGGTSTSITKYCSNSTYGTVDNLTALDLSDDAANKTWEGAWRIPTDAQLTELRNNTTLTNETLNGVAGKRLTSKLNGNSIFMPFTGYFENSEYKNEGVYGNYWSASASNHQAYAIWFPNSGAIRRGLIDRCFALAIRPVCSSNYLSIGKCGDNLSYTVDKSYKMVISGTGPMYDYSIGDNGPENSNWSFVKSVTFEEGATSIGSNTFCACSELENVTLPSTVTDIKYGAFAYSGLTSITIPNNVNKVYYQAFYGCTNLKNVIIEDGNDIIFEPSEIDEGENCGVFGSCPIEYVYLGRDIIVERGYMKNEFYDNSYPPFAGIHTIKKVIIGDSVEELPNCCFYGCPIKDLTIGENIKTIGYYAINASNSSQPLVIPASVSVLGCGLNSNIEYLVLEDGADLQLTNYANDIVVIQLFGEESGDSIYVGRNLVTKGDILEPTRFRSACFSKNIELKEKESDSGNGDTQYYSPYFIDATNLYFADGVTIGNEVFHSSKTIENIYNLYKVGDFAFAECSNLKRVEFNDNVSSIGEYAFYNCPKLTEITIPNGSIGAFSFQECSNLKKVTLGDGVNTIMESAFAQCTNLENIDISESVSSIGFGAFEGTAWYDNQPDGLVYAGNVVYSYKGTMPENTKIAIKDGSVGIASHAFEGCIDLISLAIPNSVISIGENAFSHCPGLTSLTIPTNVSSIANEIFYGCYGLITVTIGKNVTKFGDRIFYECDALTSLVLQCETPPTITTKTFYDTNMSKCTLYVPTGCKTTYEDAKGWPDFADIVEMEFVSDISKLDNAIYIEPTDGRIGGTMDLSIKMKNTTASRGFQFTLEVPEGVTINSWEVSDGRLPSGATTANVIKSGSIVDNKISVVCGLNYGDETFTGTDGEIATVNVTFGENMAEGEYPLYLTNCDITDANGKDEVLSDVKSTLTLESYVVGDANGDGAVRVGDAISILNYIVGKVSDGFNEKAADANGDGSIRVGDVITVLNIIVGKQ